MKKKVNLVFAALVFAAIAAFLTVEGAEAFCVHNNTDRTMLITQVSGGSFFGSFEENVQPGETRCCNWQNHGCNTHGHQDSPVKFEVSYEVLKPRVCYSFEIRADGDLYVTGSNGNYSCSGQ